MKIKETNMVSKSNGLNEIKGHFTELELKLFYFAVSMVRKDDKELREYIIPINDLIEIGKIEETRIYTEIRKAGRELMGKVVTVVKENGIDTIDAPLISTLETIRGEKKIAVTIPEKLKPALLELSGMYTSYQLKNLIGLNNAYSIRLYHYSVI